MKKKYIVPNTEIECCFAEVMQFALNSFGMGGHINPDDRIDPDTPIGWDFGGDGGKDDDPDAKSGGLWDAWDD